MNQIETQKRKPVETHFTEMLNAQLGMWLLSISKKVSDLKTST